MDIPHFDVPPGSSGFERIIKASAGIARSLGGFAVNFAQQGLDIAHQVVRQPTYQQL